MPCISLLLLTLVLLSVLFYPNSISSFFFSLQFFHMTTYPRYI